MSNSLYKLNTVRFLFMLETAISTVISCFLPILLLGFFNDEYTFRISSALFFTTGILVTYYLNKRSKKSLGKVNISGNHTKTIRIVTGVITISGLINALGIFKPFYKEVYLVMCYTLFILSLNLFYRLIVFSINPDLGNK